VAKECVNAILDQLHDRDTVSIILFSNSPSVFLPLTSVKELDRKKLAQQIHKWKAGGSRCDDV
jgi:hypothetical protein